MPNVPVRLLTNRRTDAQPGARRAIADFERVERERIHLSTAARVLNYEREAAEREHLATLPKAKPEDDMDWLLGPDEWHPMPVRERDRTVNITHFSPCGNPCIWCSGLGVRVVSCKENPEFCPGKMLPKRVRQ